VEGLVQKVLAFVASLSFISPFSVGLVVTRIIQFNDIYEITEKPVRHRNAFFL
jgi:hypothetical protein